jgi:hypothetical protein
MMYSKEYLIAEVQTLIDEEGITAAEAVLGICEGHELPRADEEMLIEHFQVQA